MPTADQDAAVALGLRVAVASAACLLLSESLNLEQTALSVYTAHMIMSQFPITSFQKGVERFLGRAVGVFYGLALGQLFADTPLLFLMLAVLGQVAACYVSLSGRLAYAALMAAIFIGVLAGICLTTPAAAVSHAWDVVPA